jgi:hypothetical protein
VAKLDSHAPQFVSQKRELTLEDIMRKCHLFLIALATFVLARPVRATTTAYDIDAWIDTTDYLYVHGNTLQWEHNTSGAPAGTHGGDEPTVISSTINGATEMDNVNWDQTWPSPLPSDAYSSTFTSLDPPLSTTGSEFATVSKISGRGTPSIFQEPSAANGDTLIVQFTDGFNSAAFLDAQITVSPAPEPASGLIASLGCILLSQRRRY